MCSLFLLFFLFLQKRREGKIRETASENNEIWTCDFIVIHAVLKKFVKMSLFEVYHYLFLTWQDYI